MLDSHPRLAMKDRAAYKELIGKMDAVSMYIYAF